MCWAVPVKESVRGVMFIGSSGPLEVRAQARSISKKEGSVVWRNCICKGPVVDMCPLPLRRSTMSKGRRNIDILR